MLMYFSFLKNISKFIAGFLKKKNIPYKRKIKKKIKNKEDAV